MAGTHNRKESAHSDDDTISLMSTVASVHAEDDVYEIEAIVAEEICDDGVILYLVQWKGYSEDRNTWEPIEQFTGNEIIKEWKKRQIRISEGREKAFDVTAWLERQIQLEHDAEGRKHKRQERRQWLDMDLDTRLPLSEDDTEICQDEQFSSPCEQCPSSRITDCDTPAQQMTQSATSAWTMEEDCMLERGPQEQKGPHSGEILGSSGHRGTIDPMIEGRSLEDLHEETRELQQDFVITGGESPVHQLGILAKPPTVEKNTERSGLKAKISRGEILSASEKMVDFSASLLKEEVSKDRSNSVLKATPKGITDIAAVPRDASRETWPPKKLDSTDRIFQATVLLPSSTRRIRSPYKDLDVTDDQQVLSSPRSASAERSKAPVKSPTTYTGTDIPTKPNSQPVRLISSTPMTVEPTKGARSPAQDQRRMNTARMEAVECEPARASTIKASTSGVNFIAEPKRRRTATTTKTDAPAKPFTKLSIQNSVMKSRREEPAPNRDDLIFVDPKTGKIPKTVYKPGTTLEGSRTPFQDLQETLAAEETKEYQSEDCPKPSSETMASTSVKGLQPKDRRRVESGGNTLLVKETDDPISTKEVPQSSFNAADSRQSLEAGNVLDQAHGPKLKSPMDSKGRAEKSVTMRLQGSKEHSALSGTGTAAGSKFLLASREPAFTLRSYPSTAQSHELMTIWEPTCIIGVLQLGVAGTQSEERINMKLLGLNHEMYRLLLTIKIPPLTMDFNFTKSCRARECQTYFLAAPAEILGSGFIVHYPYSKSAIESLADNMAMTLSCSLFFARNFTMIIYPAGASAWAFLDGKLPEVPQGAVLRFVILEPLSEQLASEDSIVDRLANQNIDRLHEIRTHIRDNPIQPDEKSITVVFRDMFEIEYSRLIAQNGRQKYPAADIFFLCFIPQGCELYEPGTAARMALRIRTSEEHDFFISFLEANGAQEIYSMQDKDSIEVQSNGSWDYFVNNVKSGQIIFHDACIRIDQVPNLARFLRQSTINVWKISLSPMHPAEKHPHLVRLFPHGGVILLTDSLLIYRPHEALRILMWFRHAQLPMKPSGTWKIATRPQIRDWLLELMDIITDTKHDIFGHGIQVIAAIYTEIHWLFEQSDLVYNGLAEIDVPAADAPIVTSASLRALHTRTEWDLDALAPHHDHIRQNDDLIIQWFAEWAVMHLDAFRKFHAVLGYPEAHEFGTKAIRAYEKGWGHIEVLTAEDCVKRHGVTAQDELDRIETERRRVVREQLARINAGSGKMPVD